MKAAAYVRVSSASQTHGMQRAAILRASGARGDEIDTWYQDTFTGATSKRPGLQRMREDVRAGHVRRLYVFKIDRLSRGGIRDTFDVVDELERNGCELVTLEDGFDLQGPAREMFLAFIAWAAKMERLAINERIAAAREAKRAKGERWGRPTRTGRADVDRIWKLQKAGKTVREISAALKIPRSTVGRVIAAQRKAVNVKPGESVRKALRRGATPALAKAKG